VVDGLSQQIRRGYGVGWIAEAWNLYRFAPLTWIGAGVVAFIVQIGIGSFVIEPLQGQVIKILPATLGSQRSLIRAHSWQFVLLPIAYLVQMLVNSYIAAGCLRMSLAAMRRQIVRFRDVFSGLASTMRLFGYIVVLTVGAVVACGAPIGVIAFCVINHANIVVSITGIAVSTIVLLAALALAACIAFGGAAVVDGAGVWEAYRRAFTIMRPHYPAILGVLAIFALVYAVVMCAFGFLLMAVGLVSQSDLSVAVMILAYALSFALLVPMSYIMQALIARDTLGVAGPPALPPDWLPPGGEPGPGAWPPPPKANPPPDGGLS
jgi:hypothetical protein